jgi:hypothetical protein
MEKTCRKKSAVATGHSFIQELVPELDDRFASVINEPYDLVRGAPHWFGGTAQFARRVCAIKVDAPGRAIEVRVVLVVAHTTVITQGIF